MTESPVTIASLLTRAEDFFVSCEDGEDRESMASYWVGVAKAAVAGPTALARLLDAYDAYRAAELRYATALRAQAGSGELAKAEVAIDAAIEALAECSADLPDAYRP